VARKIVGSNVVHPLDRWATRPVIKVSVYIIISRGWEERPTKTISLRPSGDCRNTVDKMKATRPWANDGALDFVVRESRTSSRDHEIVGTEINDRFVGPGSGSRTTGGSGYQRNKFMGPGCGGRTTRRPGYMKITRIILIISIRDRRKELQLVRTLGR
jgi:hypothetical protein